MAAVEQGMRESLDSGVLAGYTLVDLRATLVDGIFDEEESTEMAFKVAASMALRDGADKAAPVLLEPMMKVEAVAPDEFSGAIIGDLSARGGQIEGCNPRDRDAGSAGDGSTGRNVWLCHRFAVDDPGAGHLYDGVRSLRRGGSRRLGADSDGRAAVRGAGMLGDVKAVPATAPQGFAMNPLLR